jgi:hypothetical protein
VTVADRLDPHDSFKKLPLATMVIINEAIRGQAVHLNKGCSFWNGTGNFRKAVTIFEEEVGKGV